MAKKSLFSQSSQQKALCFLKLRLPRHFALSSSRRSENVTVTMDSATTFVAVYDTKPYDREYLSTAARMGGLHLRFHEFRLEASTAFSTEGAKSVCVFVNDDMRRSTLEALVRHGVRMVALRCAGFNNVEL